MTIKFLQDYFLQNKLNYCHLAVLKVYYFLSRRDVRVVEGESLETESDMW